MAQKIGPGTPHMPSFIVGIIVGIILILGYQHFKTPDSPTSIRSELAAPPG